MPIFRTALAISCIFSNVDPSFGDQVDFSFSSALIQSPLRMEELTGDKIVEISKIRSSVPVLFPKSVNIFERFDGSLLKFYTLDELVSNPGLVPANKFHSQSISSKSKTTLDRKEISFSQREKQLFDTSLLLVPKHSTPLPSDDQLRAFLQEGQKRDVAPVKPEEIISNLLKDDYANHPVISLLNDSPEVQKVLKSASFNQSSEGLFNSANHALNANTSVLKSASFDSPISPPELPSSEQTPTISNHEGPTTLKLKARKPSRDGTLKPAQASEIYLTTQDLKELLKDLGSDPAVAGEVRSVAELWAKAEKNVSHNPEIALGVKSILLSAKVGRARTDPYGHASLENLSPDDKYFVIGIDKDIETDVVTIWSKEVEVSPGENLVELSSTDIIYQE